MRTQVLIYGVTGQSLDHVPERPVDTGTATWVLEDTALGIDDADRVLDSGSATIPSASLTTDAVAGWTEASPTKIPVTATTGATVGPWWIEDPEGIGEIVYLEGWVAADYLRTRWPLARNYATGSTVRPLTITAAIDDAVAADEDHLDHDSTKLRVVWTYEVDGRKSVHQELVKVDRQLAGDGALSDVIAFAIDYFPELGGQVRGDTELERWARLAQRMITNRMSGLGKGVDRSRFLVGDRAVELHAFKLLCIAADNGLNPGTVDPAAYRKTVAAEFDAIWSSLTVGHPGQGVVETDEDGVNVGATERQGLSFSW